MNGTCDSMNIAREYQHQPPHVVNVATLPCESWSSENV